MHWTKYFLSLVLLSICGRYSTAFQFNVDAHREECFYESLTPRVPVSIMFQVVKGGFLDIDVQIKSPSGNILYNAEKQSEGKQTFFTHEVGLYAFCFGNRMSTLTPKVVSFVLTTGATPPPPPQEVDVITPLELAIEQLRTGLKAVLDEQNYMEMRERVHRNTNESTNQRVIWWSIFEIGILIAMSLWQIYYLRRFFEVKRVI